MKKFVLELSQGEIHLGSWNMGDNPITLRIIEEEEVLLEILLRTPEKETDTFRYGRSQGDDFTMPIPVHESEGSKENKADLSNLVALPQEIPISSFTDDEANLLKSQREVSLSKGKERKPKFLEPEPTPDRELSFELSASIILGTDYENPLVEDESAIDFDPFRDAPLSDSSIEFVAPAPDEILHTLRESINGIDDIRAANEDLFEEPPEIPAIPGFDDVEIAVWKPLGGQWTCLKRLKANEEYAFHGVQIWVDNSASLLLTGRKEMKILVQHVDGQEEEYLRINGSLDLPSRAIVLLQFEGDSLCFRPE